MDDPIAASAFEPHWIGATNLAGAAGGTSLAGAAGGVHLAGAAGGVHLAGAAGGVHLAGAAGGRPARMSRFLQRDLSDEALREPAEPVFSRNELDSVRQEGFDAGHSAGMAAAAASRAAARTAAEIQALGIIAAAITDARRDAARVADLAADALARTVIAAMDAVMPELIRRSALNEVSAMLAHVLPALSREPAVRVEIGAEIAESIAASLASLPAELRDTIAVAGVDHMRIGDARIHWSAGHARRQPDEVWRSVMAALQPALAPPDLAHPELAHPEAKDRQNGE
jgi:hypothetical protein